MQAQVYEYTYTYIVQDVTQRPRNKQMNFVAVKIE